MARLNKGLVLTAAAYRSLFAEMPSTNRLVEPGLLTSASMDPFCGIYGYNAPLLKSPPVAVLPSSMGDSFPGSGGHCGEP